MSDAAELKSRPLAFRPVDNETWRDFERLFESSGAPKYCWCMVWRRTAEEAKHNDGPHRKRQMKARVGKGVPIGLIAYAGDVPTAWVSIAPRETYRNLGGPEAGPEESVWSLVCFYVPRRLRGEGMVHRLIEAAVNHARERGATVVEAYPVDEGAPSYRFMGFVPAFEKAGFNEVGRAGIRRHVMRKELGQRRSR